MPSKKLVSAETQEEMAAYFVDRWKLSLRRACRLVNLSRTVYFYQSTGNGDRECLLLRAASTFPSFAVERELEWLFLVHGKPEAIVSDNGPEFRAMTLPQGVASRFIQPGSPWQNGHVESFFDKLTDELLYMEIFPTGKDLPAYLTGLPPSSRPIKAQEGSGA